MAAAQMEVDIENSAGPSTTTDKGPRKRFEVKKVTAKIYPLTSFFLLFKIPENTDLLVDLRMLADDIKKKFVIATLSCENLKIYQNLSGLKLKFEFNLSYDYNSEIFNRLFLLKLITSYFSSWNHY